MDEASLEQRRSDVNIKGKRPRTASKSRRRTTSVKAASRFFQQYRRNTLRAGHKLIEETPQSLQYHCVREHFEVALPSMEVLLTDQSPNDNFDRLAKSLATELLAHEAIKTRRLSLMVFIMRMRM